MWTGLSHHIRDVTRTPLKIGKLDAVQLVIIVLVTGMCDGWSRKVMWIDLFRDGNESVSILVKALERQPLDAPGVVNSLVSATA